MIIPIALLTITAAGCTKADSGATASGVTLVNAGKLTVCTHLPYPPFQAKKADGSGYEGFDIALMDLVAKKLGVTQQIVDTPFEGIKSGQDLNTGKCDVAAAAMTITAERANVLDFSQPYFDATQALLIRAGTPYQSADSISGWTIGVQAGTTGADYMEHKYRSVAPAKYSTKAYRDVASLQQALATGQINAAVNDLPVWTNFVRANPGKYTLAASYDTGEQYGYAVRKGVNPKLAQAINDAIAEARKDGSYDALYRQWIGEKPQS